MAEKVHVRSIDVLEEFRRSLLIYIDRAVQALDEISEDVRRTRSWVETDQRQFWTAEYRKRKKKLEQAEAELFSARLSTLIDTPSVQQMMVKKARAEIQVAEEKLRVVKRWNQNFDQRVEPLLRKIERLRDTLGHDLPNAVAWLAEAQKTLQDYAETGRPATTAPPPPIEEEGDGKP